MGFLSLLTFLQAKPIKNKHSTLENKSAVTENKQVALECTLVILKPDCMQKYLQGEIMKRFCDKGLKTIACKMIQLDDSILREHYSHLTDKPFFPNLTNYMKECPVIVMVLQGKDAIKTTRELLGATNPANAGKGTIRGDFGENVTRNVVHASDSNESATKEIARFFKTEEIFK